MVKDLIGNIFVSIAKNFIVTSIIHYKYNNLCRTGPRIQLFVDFALVVMQIVATAISPVGYANLFNIKIET